MPNINRDIGTEDLKIIDFVERLKSDKFLIPTFQRDFVWQPENIIKLWDSIYNFYPISSILYWETNSYLHTHRKLGGFTFPHDEDTVRKFKEWANICFLRAKTNIQIGKKNPLHYFREYEKKNPTRFDEILSSHLIPRKYLEKPSFNVSDYVDFLKDRTELFSKKVESALPDVEVKIVD